MATPCSLSIVVPAYNEAHAIERHLSAICAFVEEYSRECPGIEILVVDDGSKDETASLVEKMASGVTGLRLLRLGKNQGKGAAVLHGLCAASGQIRGFTDADGSTPIEELRRVVPLLRNSADVVIGSRAVRDPKRSVEAFAHRRLMGRIFNALLRSMVRLRDGKGQPLLDTQCGFKWMRSEVVAAISPEMTIRGFAFDVEMLLLAQLHGFSISEMPVRWKDYGHSHVNLLSDPLKMLREVARIAWRHRGRARLTSPTAGG